MQETHECLRKMGLGENFLKSWFFLQLQYGKTETHKVCPTEKSGPVIERCVSDVVVAIPAREVSNPTLSGYLDRKLLDGTWK